MAKEIKQYGMSQSVVDPTSGKKATTEEVEKFHTNSDLDLRAEAQHHSLGPGPTQASPGNHTHDGGTSPLLLDGYTITGSRNSDAWRLQINAMLVRLGAKDTSTT